MNPTVTSPIITVIVPVRNDPQRLSRCLAALSQSTCRSMEVLVMDDASTDDTPKVAGELGANVVRMERRGGPGVARNKGAELAKGQYVMFVDADVCVHPQTVERVVAHFEGDRELDALFGSYDTNPADGHFVSQYKNLFHHYVHQRANEQASTFWAGCGAMRRDVFRQFGGFDVNYGRPSIEDIELGVRLHHAGRKIAIKKDVQATHLKRWTLWGLIKTDVFDRGVPWTRLILERGGLPNDLNLRTSQRISAMLACLLLATAAAGIVAITGWLPWVWLWWVLAAGSLAGIVAINHDFYRFLFDVRGLLFAMAAAPMHVLYYLYSGAAMVLGSILHFTDKSGSKAGRGNAADDHDAPGIATR